MPNFLDTLLRDSAEGEHFCPTEEPTFRAAPERQRVPMLQERAEVARALPELLQSADDATFKDVDFLTALLRMYRPLRDADRFTTGLGLVAPPVGFLQSDPFPILF